MLREILNVSNFRKLISLGLTYYELEGLTAQ